ncbi:MAG: hypothetical protein AAF447_23260 [Myxococcota bacterium]
MRSLAFALVSLLVFGCGDEERMSFGSGFMPNPPSPARDAEPEEDAGGDAGAPGDAGLPFACAELAPGSGPQVSGDEPFEARSASALFNAVPDCDTQAVLSVLVFGDEGCSDAAARVQIVVPIEDPTVVPGENPIGFESSGVQLSYVDARGRAFGASVGTVGSVSLSQVPTRTTPAETRFTFTPDALLGVVTPGSDAVPVQIAGSVTVPLGAQFSCMD